MPKTVYLKDFTADKFAATLTAYGRYLMETDRGKSVKSYLGDVRRFIGWLVAKYGKVNLQAVSPLDLVEYRQALQDQGKAPGTVNRALTSLKVFFVWLRETRQVRDSPVDGVRLVAGAPRLAPKWLTRPQQAAFVRAVREKGSLRDEALVGTMLHAGLRVGEVCALRRDDLHIGERAGKLVVRQGKGNKYREVPLNKTVRRLLARWLEANPDGPLFPNRKRGPIAVRGVFGLVAGYAYKAHLPGVTPHTLRHTFCKNALDLGVPIDQVAAMAGHSSLDVTRRYTAPSMVDLQAAAERLAWE
ncbi:MAG: tyrosine-type recombinase/integrase [Bacillota bacterium]